MSASTGVPLRDVSMHLPLAFVPLQIRAAFLRVESEYKAVTGELHAAPGRGRASLPVNNAFRSVLACDA